MHCPLCNKEVESLEELAVNINDEDLGVRIKLCQDCLATVKDVLSRDDFGPNLVNFLSDLASKWEMGNSENSKVGSIVKILRLEGEDEGYLFSKTGVVEFIDDAGQLHGTWGGVAIIPDKDSFLVAK